jgi:hypothetical protein
MSVFMLSAAATIGPMINAIYESFNAARLGAFLVMLILLHLALHPRLALTRELMLYLFLFAYMALSLLWAPSIVYGINTLLPAANFVLLMILFGSLVAFHSLRSVLAGSFFGSLAAALFYGTTVGFPFVYPPEFSYNAIAAMYLTGLFFTLAYGWHTRSRLFPLIVSLLILVHIAATTSIKTNLGIVLGACASALIYSRNFLGMLRRNVLPLSILIAGLVFAIQSNQVLLEQVQNGFARVSRGVEILRQREDVVGGTSFGERSDWKNQGIKGWIQSPLFGNGVEAFRADNGVTSHSTPIDLLYNTGVIGFMVFYAIFVSLGLRLARFHGPDLGGLPALIFGGLVCYFFITLSGTMHYNSFMAIFFGVSVGLLGRYTVRPVRAPTAAVEALS